MKKLLLFAFAIFLLSLTGKAQEQLTHLQASSNDLNAYPREFVAFEGKLYFSAFSNYNGQELWVTDGTEANTKLYQDINPGVGSSTPKSLLAHGNALYFIANDGISGEQVFKKGANSDALEKLTAFQDVTIARLTQVGNAFFFIAIEDSWLHVWKSDGTKAATLPVIENLPTWSHYASFESTSNGLFIFQFRGMNTNGSEVWRSDGTAAGTFPVTSELSFTGAGSDGFAPDGSTAAMSQHISYKNALYFVTRSGAYFGATTPVGILKTDGNTTIPLKAVLGGWETGGSTIVNVAKVVELEGKLYFYIFQLDPKRVFIWESDGSAVGTRKIYDRSAEATFSPSNLLVHQGKLWFMSAGEGGTGTSLVSYDPGQGNFTVEMQLEETTMKPPVLPIGWDLGILVSLNSETLLAGITKGSAPYDRNYSFINLSTKQRVPAPTLRHAASFYPYAGKHYFPGFTNATGTELYTTQGTLETTQLLKNINSGKEGLLTSDLKPLGTKLIFDAIDNQVTLGRELYYYDTQANKANLLADINAGPPPSYPEEYVRFKDKLYFSAVDEVAKVSLWATDGTTQGTTLIGDPASPLTSYFPMHLTPLGEQALFYVGEDEDRQHHLLKTDGATITPLQSLGLNKNGAPFSVSKVVVAGEKVYYSVLGEISDLWVSDGTPAGTQKVLDLCGLDNMVAFKGQLYFTAINRESAFCMGQPVLWKSDGTVAGTVPIMEPGQAPFTRPRNFYVYNNTLYFVAYTAASGYELWKSDGTAAGTSILLEIAPGRTSSVSQPHFQVYKDKLYFAATDGMHGVELWRTDGSAAGTVMASDIASGTLSAFPQRLTVIGDALYFAATTPEHGTELWQSDGVTVKQLADVLPGANHSDPSHLMQIGEELYFMANTASQGRQLWSISSQVTAIEDEVAANQLVLYPNPGASHVSFSLENANGRLIKDVMVVDLQGKQIKANVDFARQRIDVSALMPGLYMITFQIQEQRITKRFIKLNNH